MVDEGYRRLTSVTRSVGQGIQDRDGSQHTPAKPPSAARAVSVPPPSRARDRHHTRGNPTGAALIGVQPMCLGRRHAAPRSEREAAAIALSKRAQIWARVAPKLNSIKPFPSGRTACNASITRRCGSWRPVAFHASLVQS